MSGLEDESGILDPKSHRTIFRELTQHTKEIEAQSVNRPDSVSKLGIDVTMDCVFSPGKLEEVDPRPWPELGTTCPDNCGQLPASLYSVKNASSCKNLPRRSISNLRRWYLIRTQMCQEGEASTGALLEGRVDTIKMIHAPAMSCYQRSRALAYLDFNIIMCIEKFPGIHKDDPS